MWKVLDKKFFERPATAVAHDLIGKFLLRNIRGNVWAFVITETEAYDGPEDRASHAHRGKTARNSVMFGEAGVCYVYFTYGMHWMLNVVTGPIGYPAAVLIRGVDGINGPARLCRALTINGRFNGLPASRKTGLWFEDRGVRIPRNKIEKLPRVGVAYAGPIWSKKQYRFICRYA